MTSVANLSSPISKLERAAAHYRHLKEDFLGGFDRRLVPVTTQISQDGLTCDFVAQQVVPLGGEFSLVLGDGFFNLRCALDHLVYQLHVNQLGSPLPDDAERDSAFPVMDKEPMDGGKPIPASKWKGVKRLSAANQAMVAELQPFHGWRDFGKMPRPLISELRQTLHEVNWFNIQDKHRELHLVESMPSEVWMPPASLKAYGVANSPAFGVPLKSGMVVDTWNFDIAPPAEEIENPGFYSAVVVEPQPGERVDVVQSLGANILGVTKIVMRFAGQFPSQSFPDFSDIMQSRG